MVPRGSVARAAGSSSGSGGGGSGSGGGGNGGSRSTIDALAQATCIKLVYVFDRVTFLLLRAAALKSTMQRVVGRSGADAHLHVYLNACMLQATSQAQ